MGKLKQRFSAAHKLLQFLNVVNHLGLPLDLQLEFSQPSLQKNQRFILRTSSGVGFKFSSSCQETPASDQVALLVGCEASYSFPGSYLARCQSKAFAIFVVVLGIVKRVFLGHCVWIFCCGCGHCLPSLSLCGRGWDSAGRTSILPCAGCLGLIHPESLAPSSPSGKSELIPDL